MTMATESSSCYDMVSAIVVVQPFAHDCGYIGFPFVASNSLGIVRGSWSVCNSGWDHLIPVWHSFLDSVHFNNYWKPTTIATAGLESSVSVMSVTSQFSARLRYCHCRGQHKNSLLRHHCEPKQPLNGGISYFRRWCIGRTGQHRTR